MQKCVWNQFFENVWRKIQFGRILFKPWRLIVFTTCKIEMMIHLDGTTLSHFSSNQDAILTKWIKCHIMDGSHIWIGYVPWWIAIDHRFDSPFKCIDKYPEIEINKQTIRQMKRGKFTCTKKMQNAQTFALVCSAKGVFQSQYVEYGMHLRFIHENGTRLLFYPANYDQTQMQSEHTHRQWATVGNLNC